MSHRSLDAPHRTSVEMRCTGAQPIRVSTDPTSEAQAHARTGHPRRRSLVFGVSFGFFNSLLDVFSNLCPWSSRALYSFSPSFENISKPETNLGNNRNHGEQSPLDKRQALTGKPDRSDFLLLLTLLITRPPPIIHGFCASSGCRSLISLSRKRCRQAKGWRHCQHALRRHSP
jgi:hypothetical protein